MSHLYKKYMLLVWLGLLLTTGLIATCAITLYAAHDLQQQNSGQQTLPLTGDAIDAQIQRNIARAVIGTSALAIDTLVRDWMLSGEPDNAALQSHLKAAQRKDQSLSHFVAVEKEQQFLDSQGAVRALNSEDSWYAKTRTSINAFETTVLPEWGSINRPVIFISYRINDNQGNFLGVNGVLLPLELISPAVLHTAHDFNRAIYFVDANGAIVFSGDLDNRHGNIREHEGIKQVANDILTLAHGENSQLYVLDSVKQLINTRYIPELGWTLVVEQSNADGDLIAHPLLLANLLLGLLVLGLALALAWVWIRNQQKQVTALANRDGMTGLMNRQSFTTSFQQAVLDMRRSGSPLCFILFDIDFLKKINQLHGHVTGDRIIKEIARMSRQSVRGSDLLCRWGGEQFALLLKKCELEQAYKIAEQLRLNVQNCSFSLQDAEPVTISLGVAEWAEDETADDLFARVGEAMDLAKSEGRNRAEVSYFVNA